MTIKLVPPIDLNKTNFKFDEDDLSKMSCGLFRMNLQEAIDTQPYYADLLKSAPVAFPEDYEVDIKVHMLMPDQYPCIPNWHCDNIPRAGGLLQYSEVHKDTPMMLLWLSDNPTTEFLSEPMEIEVPNDHQELTKNMEKAPTKSIESNRWVAMSQHSPHRGTKSKDFLWRVFVRITHKSITPSRKVISTERRHCQVYLDAGAFGW